MPGNIINLSLDDIAAWPKANYTNPTRRQWNPGYAAILYAFATLSVLVRTLSRIRRGHAGGLGLDDILLLGGWGLLTWFTILNILGSEKYMTSRHMWDIPMTMYEKMAKITWIAELVFLLCGCCVKVSVLLFYRRIGEGTYSKLWNWACVGAIYFTVAWSMAFVLVLVFNCTPTEAYWRGFSSSYTKKFRCVDTTVNNLLAGVLAVVSDLYSVALPCLLMRQLQLPRAQKLGLYVVFTAGLMVVAAGSVRTYHLHKVGHSSDVSSAVFDIFVWSQLELCLGYMCASAPSLRVFFRTHLQSPLSRLKQSCTSGSRGTTARRGTDPEVEGSPGRQRKGGAGNGDPWPYARFRYEQGYGNGNVRRKTPEPMLTDVTTLVEELELEDVVELPRKPPAVAAPAMETGMVGRTREEERQSPARFFSQQKQKLLQKRQSPLHSTQNSGGTQTSRRCRLTTCTQDSRDIDLQDNIIVDGYNRGWLDEGFEERGVTSSV